ncbi:ferredoxin-NADPH reductase [Microbacterium sp. AZCO]|uniref:ferredoxin-NADPH reductase n=1 Tax=Microbacterium sp. AZCO TaxID=3142976 RepID=UPI0031F348E4
MNALRRISHESYANVFGVVYLGLMTNALLLAASFPLVLLLVTTDPARSWPLLAVAAPLAAPGLTATFTVFRAHAAGSTTVARDFVGGLRATWRRSLALGAMLSTLVVVLLVDVRFFSDSPFAVVAIPALAVLTVLAMGTGLLAFVAIAEDPHARLRDLLRASAWLAVRRWYLSAVSLLVLAAQATLFASLPAIAIGLTAAAALYLAWANSRFTLRPVLAMEDAQAA